jgi:hypothetical protein
MVVVAPFLSVSAPQVPSLHPAGLYLSEGDVPPQMPDC